MSIAAIATPAVIQVGIPAIVEIAKLLVKAYKDAGRVISLDEAIADMMSVIDENAAADAAFEAAKARLKARQAANPT